MNRGRGRNVHGGGGYWKQKRTGPASPVDSSPPKRDVQQPKPKLSNSTCLNGNSYGPACTGSKDESSRIGRSLQGLTLELSSSPVVDSPSQQRDPLLPGHSGSKDMPFKTTGSQFGQASSDNVGNSKNSVPVIKPFDICLVKEVKTVHLNRPLFDKNREIRKVDQLSKNGGPQHCLLRPGMVLLKNYLSRSDQVKIIKVCRDLGLGPGGFQQPGYRDGAKLHLMMMCFGKHWDPNTGLYVDKRPTDEAVAPNIPAELTMLVGGVIQASHDLVKKKKRDPEDELPSMQPDICIVNFYSNSGKLGLHQDKDESKRSLEKGLPVVSFSIGDSAEFLYGDHVDIERAEKVLLESGDVLIFGGMSRHIFHGVKSIIPETAPKTLVDDTNLRPGRLNLTFRQY